MVEMLPWPDYEYAQKKASLHASRNAAIHALVRQSNHEVALVRKEYHDTVAPLLEAPTKKRDAKLLEIMKKHHQALDAINRNTDKQIDEIELERMKGK